MGRSVDNTLKDVASTNAEFAGDPIAQIANLQHMHSKRIVFLSSDMNEWSIANVITELIGLANIDPVTPINLIVSTYGGSIDEMNSLIDVMNFIPCEVHTIGLAKIMSAGVMILASGQKGKRVIGKNARLMMHSVSTTMAGNVFNLANDLDEVKRQQEALVDGLAAVTKMTKKQVNKIMQSGYDTYLTPEQAVQYGIVDRIIENKKIK